MGLTVDQVMAFHPCAYFTRSEVENAFAGKTVCYYDDFMAMSIRAGDKLFCILRNEILTQDRLDAVSSLILGGMLSATAMEEYNSLPDDFKAAVQLAVMYARDFDWSGMTRQQRLDIIRERYEHLITLVGGIV